MVRFSVGVLRVELCYGTCGRFTGGSLIMATVGIVVVGSIVTRTRNGGSGIESSGKRRLGRVGGRL